MPVYDDLDTSDSAQFVERCRRDFEATGNPLYAWEAWGMVRLTWRSQLDQSLELPEWIAEYFDACGSRLLGWRPERVELSPHQWGHLPEEVPPAPGKGAGAIGRAVGFSQGLALARANWGGQFDERENLASELVQLMWQEGLSLDAAAHRAEQERRCSYRTARRAVEHAQRGALAQMQAYLREGGESATAAGAYRRYSTLCDSRGAAKRKHPR